MRLFLPIVILASLLMVLFLLPDPHESLSAHEETQVHWHAELNIVINGAQIPVPAGVGLPGKKRMHTHDWDNIIHMEDSVGGFTLGEFFDNWGVVFNRTCLFQFCDEDEHMYVNGVENMEFEQYHPQDGDHILLEVMSR